MPLYRGDVWKFKCHTLKKKGMLETDYIDKSKLWWRMI